MSDDPSRHQISDGQVTSGSSYVNKRGMGKCLQSIIYFFIFGVGGGGARGGEREFRGYEIASVSIFGPKQCFSEVFRSSHARISTFPAHQAYSTGFSFQTNC